MVILNKELKNQILTPNSGVSSMRYVMLEIVSLLKLTAYAIILLILYRAYSEQDIDWSGIATLIGAWGVILIPTLGAKAWQKFSETKTQ